MTCVDGVCASSELQCEGSDPSITCLDTGCPEGQVCTPGDDGGCVPSSCSCSEGEWVCTADCGQPHACAPEENPSTCPASEPLGMSCDPTTNTSSCEYGEECCCGSCSPSLVCDCNSSGSWSCFHTDACLIGSCEGNSCQADSDCALFEGEENALTCVDGVCASSELQCEGSDPSITCLDTGCPEGQVCTPGDDGGCVPSSCSCSEGEWVCTADCGQPHACAPEENPSTCPASEPLGMSCDPTTNTSSCEYGEECCCGSCSPSLVCDCDSSGSWSCFHTDACFINSCEGSSCQQGSDCVLFEGEENTLSCIDNVCTSVADDCQGFDREACDISSACEWFWAVGCPSGEFPALEQNTCLPNYPRCTSNNDCPSGTTCEHLEVLPECAVGENPEDPICDACSMVESRCTPRE